jgi:hypothetical protein
MCPQDQQGLGRLRDLRVVCSTLLVIGSAMRDAPNRLHNIARSVWGFDREQLSAASSKTNPVHLKTTRFPRSTRAKARSMPLHAWRIYSMCDCIQSP